MTKALVMMHDTDPREDLLAKVGGLVDHVVPLGSNVMVAIYERPAKTKFGILLPENVGARKEDEHQGKVGLVLRLGPIAFKEDERHSFGALLPKHGDWIVYSVSETFSFMLGDIKIRMVEDVAVKAIVDQPDIVY